MASKKPQEPITVRMGVLTPDELAALGERRAAFAEGMAEDALAEGKDQAWFTKHRENLRYLMLEF